ncbi:hypothetical protein AVEN_272288-1 [Araneus ventricosus]|uniref:Uncharacterized protein n=1 Tax=Araneus ventricosus TaxID=182803 RepID=A0A4Y2PI00_ARAVE|nr:hypothetical protein AVEN_272288-1 [Araneus ventricosus]
MLDLQIVVVWLWGLQEVAYLESWGVSWVRFSVVLAFIVPQSATVDPVLGLYKNDGLSDQQYKFYKAIKKKLAENSRSGYLLGNLNWEIYNFVRLMSWFETT